MSLSNTIVPGVICFLLMYGLYQGVDVFDCFLRGAREGLKTAVDILPVLVALLTCIGMFKASGGLDILTALIVPLSSPLGIPDAVLPLAVLRPISASGTLVLFTDLLHNHGPDSFVGRVASVMYNASETTFYIIAVYYGSVGVSRTRQTLPAALTADLVCLAASTFVVSLLFGG